MKPKPAIVRVGEGKWHELSVTVSDDLVYTACNINLDAVRSPIHKAEIEVKNGEPTCKHCLRLRARRLALS